MLKIGFAPFAKVMGLGGLQTLILLATSFLSVKITAVFLGPTGVVLIAQLQGLITICSGAVTNVMGTSVVRLGAEYGTQSPRHRLLLGTAKQIALWFGVLATIGLLAAGAPMTDWLLGRSQSVVTIPLAGLGVAALVYASVTRGAMGSNQEMKAVAISNIAGGVLSFIFVAAGTLAFGLTGALIATAVAGISQLAAVSMVARSMSATSLPPGFGMWSRSEALHIASFVPMLLAHTAAQPITLIFLRQHVTSQLSIADAGYFQATFRISEIAMTIITSTISLYFMPRLGAVIGDKRNLRGEVIRVVSYVAVAAGTGAAIVIALRRLIVPIVFSDAFAPVADLLPWQMVAATVKTIGWTFGFVLVAQMRTVWYVTIEIVVPALFLIIGIWLSKSWGAHGVVIAYVISSCIHLILSVIALRGTLFEGGLGESR